VVQHLHRQGQAAAACLPQATGIHRLARCGATRHQGLPLPHISPVLVEGDEDRHHQLVQRLPGVPCKMSKTTRQSAAAVQPIPVPSRRFTHVHVDLVGPLPTSTEGWSYIIMMDRSTRWIEAAPVRDTWRRRPAWTHSSSPGWPDSGYLG
jgi:hypothetical protein